MARTGLGKLHGSGEVERKLEVVEFGMVSAVMWSCFRRTWKILVEPVKREVISAER